MTTTMTDAGRDVTHEHFYRGPGGEWWPDSDSAIAAAICDEVASGRAQIYADKSARTDDFVGYVRVAGADFAFWAHAHWDVEGYESMVVMAAE